MLLFAATALEKASKVPGSFWLKVVLFIVGFILLVVILRKLAEVNKVAMLLVGMVVFGILGFSWIYERNEPAFLTPVVDAIAPFFPAKNSYEATQKADPGNSLKKPKPGSKAQPAK
jgi:apolipoprotein N-acyltransferase